MEFTEIEPDETCVCGGCTAGRRARLHAARPAAGGHPAARGARRAAVLLAAVGTMLSGAAGAGAAPTTRPGTTATDPTDTSGTAGADTPQGEPSGLSGGRILTPHLRSAGAATTRAAILARAQRWVDQQVPYSMSTYWSDGYRQDCSGFVSMAWGLGSSQTTWTLPEFADRIARDDLQPGDILVRNNPDDPQSGSHTVLFAGWTDSTRTHYLAYEQTRPSTRRRATPYAYWSHSDAYIPYRYRGLSEGVVIGPGSAFPGAASFGPGACNTYVTRLGELLVRRGGGRFYVEGPDPSWGEADRRATQAFQLAQGWRGSEADGIPGKDTWDYLVNGKGRDIPPEPTLNPPPPRVPAPPYPGADAFGPGRSGPAIQQLGEQLVKRGYGRHYTDGPGPDWTENDRLNVADFQLAQGWTGTEADGYPGPDTWKLLFS
ncbi:peptidoglycan-binding protein [Kitasatospora sp. MAP5-34]|uniref:peptidoglycan-binding protein n=1 Tax=Kitasatospora sp. MAP5-34 TaxID=3035102 RepID=UPI0032AEC6C1